MYPEDSLPTDRISAQAQNKIETPATSSMFYEKQLSTCMDPLIKNDSQDEVGNHEMKNIKITEVISLKNELIELEEYQSCDLQEESNCEEMEVIYFKREEAENETCQFDQLAGENDVTIKKEPIDNENNGECSNVIIVDNRYIKQEIDLSGDEIEAVGQSRSPISVDLKIKDEIGENFEDSILTKEQNVERGIHDKEDTRNSLSSWHPDIEDENKKVAVKEECIVQPIVSFNTKGLNKCEVCGKLFKRLSTYKAHALFHIKEYPHECNFCSLRFKLLNESQRHEQIHWEKQCQCKICGRICKNEGYLKQHSVIHLDKIFECNECGKEFTRCEQLYGHMAVHRDEHHQCKICEKVFEKSIMLKKHSVIHFRKPEGVKLKKKMSRNIKKSTNNRCNICNRNFKKLVALKSHLKTHSGIECQVCSKTFPSLISLQKHVQTHMDECPYECTICSQKFTCSYSLKEHTHEKQCNDCKKVFVDLSSFRLHVCDKSLPVVYVCVVCYKTFQSMKALKVHSSCHETKSYECMICSKICDNLSLLKIHVRSHMQDGYHECMVCGKSYRHLRSLRRHEQCHRRQLKDTKFEDES